eukprot:tig00021179_g19255.t1
MAASIIAGAASLVTKIPVVGSRIEAGAHFVARRLVLDTMSRLKAGCLRLQYPDGTVQTFGDPTCKDSALTVELKLVRPDSFFWRVLMDADIGISEAYMHGDFECSDLVAFFRVLIANRDLQAISDKDVVLSFLGRLFNGYMHSRRKNTLSGSAKNIQDHYDLSNDLFRIFLSPDMTYSCALFRSDSETLEDGQRNKLLHIIRKARICKDDHVLEVGCGWGSFACLAVQTTGCRVTCITLSIEQLREVEARAAALGISDRIQVKLIDYRTMQGQFDKVVSIEMLEAVGYEFYDAYFSSIDRLLKPDGVAVIQVITTPDQRFEYYRQGVDFIQKHIFPGSLCPSLTCLLNSITRSSNLMIHHLEDIGFHYARTLREWRHTFEKRKDDVKALGFNEVFFRKFVYYFAYCEAGFATRTLGDLHLVLTRPNNSALPAFEEDAWRLPEVVDKRIPMAAPPKKAAK